MIPSLQELMTYRSLWALCSVNKSTQKLEAIYYLTCLVSGRAPLWAVYRVATGKFQKFVGSKSEAERMYPRLVWRRRMAQWKMSDDSDSKAPERRHQMANIFGATLPQYEDKGQPPANPPRAGEARPSARMH